MKYDKARATLGIDLDECVFHYVDTIAPYIAKATDRPVKELVDPEHYSMTKSGWCSSREEFTNIHGDAVTNHEIYRNLPVIEGASQTLWELSNEGFHIVIVTSRFVNNRQHAEVLRQTGLALDEADIPYHDICFLAQKHLLAADIFLDDAPANIESLQEAGREVLIMDRSYNRDLEGQRVHNWTEIGDIIRKKFPPLT